MKNNSKTPPSDITEYGDEYSRNGKRGGNADFSTSESFDKDSKPSYLALRREEHERDSDDLAIHPHFDRLNKEQVWALEMMLKGKTHKEIAKFCGVSTVTIWNWRNNTSKPGCVNFRKALAEIRDYKFDDVLKGIEVDKKLYQMALSGSHAHMELWYRLHGELIQKGVIPETIIKDMEGLTDDERDQALSEELRRLIGSG